MADSKNIMFIWLGAVWHTIIRSIDIWAKKQNRKLNFFILSRDNTFEDELQWYDIKYKTIIQKDFKKFLSTKKKFDQNIDITINCVSPIFNKSILQRCIANKSYYLDLASNIWADELQKKEFEQDWFDHLFRKNKLTWIYNAGVSPGISEILINYVIRKYAITPISIEIYLKENFDSMIPLFSWSPSTAVDEILTKPIYIDNKEVKYWDIFAPQSKCAGKKKSSYYRVTQEELVSLLSSYEDVSNLSMYISWSEIEKIKFLYDIWLLSQEKAGNMSLVDIVKSKMPKSATPSEIKYAYRHGLIDDARFAFHINILWSDSTYTIILDYNKKSFDKIQNSIFSWSTSISYPTWLWASLVLQYILSQFDSLNKWVYNCIKLAEQMDIKYINKYIIKYLKSNNIKIKIKKSYDKNNICTCIKSFQ